MLEHQRQGTVDLVRPDEAVTTDRVGEIQAVFERCLGHGQPRVVVNFDRVPMIDGAGLEFLLHWRDRYAGCGGALKLAAPNALCADILRITGVSDEVEVYRDPVAAVASFAQ